MLEMCDSVARRVRMNFGLPPFIVKAWSCISSVFYKYYNIDFAILQMLFLPVDTHRSSNQIRLQDRSHE